MNEEVTIRVQKNIVTFCQYIIKEYMEKWKTAVRESKKITQVLNNLTYQLKHVEKAHLPTMPNFDLVKENVTISILELIEEEFIKIKQLIEQLNVANQDLKNKLSTLERSSNGLDFTHNIFPVKGNSTQPSLPLLLYNGYEFCNYFFNVYQIIKENMGLFDPKSEKTVESLKSSFDIDLKSDLIVNYLCLISTVGCENFQIRDLSICMG